MRFSPHDNIISGGSRSGVIKLWSLEQSKLVRALSGHASSIYSIDFHPFADYITTGSADTAVKLFDIRKKCCLTTYKAHKDAVRCVRFTPDGHYIISGGEDYSIRVWDMRQGRQLVVLNEHSGSVNCFEFHPHEMLMASGGSDRVVRLWDVDKFKIADSTDPRTSTGDIRSLAFHPDGLCIYAGIDGGVRVFSWEPTNCLDSVTLSGPTSGRLADIRTNPVNSQLITVSLMGQSQVVTHAVDYGLLAPVADRPSGRADRPTTTRRSYSSHNDRPRTSCNSGRSRMGDDDSADGNNAVDIKNFDEYKALFAQQDVAPPPATNRLPNVTPISNGFSESPRRSSVQPSVGFPQVVTISKRHQELGQYNPLVPKHIGLALWILKILHLQHHHQQLKPISMKKH